MRRRCACKCADVGATHEDELVNLSRYRRETLLRRARLTVPCRVVLERVGRRVAWDATTVELYRTPANADRRGLHYGKSRIASLSSRRSGVARPSSRRPSVRPSVSAGAAAVIHDRPHDSRSVASDPLCRPIGSSVGRKVVASLVGLSPRCACALRY
jgi:hypothetical protein